MKSPYLSRKHSEPRQPSQGTSLSILALRYDAIHSFSSCPGKVVTSQIQPMIHLTETHSTNDHTNEHKRFHRKLEPFGIWAKFAFAFAWDEEPFARLTHPFHHQNENTKTVTKAGGAAATTAANCSDVAAPAPCLKEIEASKDRED